MLADIDLSEMEQRGDAPLEKQKAMLEAVQRIPGVTAAGDGEPRALYRRAARRSGFPARNDRFQSEQFCAGAIRVYDLAGLPGGCGHSGS